MRPKFLDAAIRQAQARAALERALHAAREEADADNFWLREHSKDFALGYLCGLLTVLMVYLLVHGVAR